MRQIRSSLAMLVLAVLTTTVACNNATTGLGEEGAVQLQLSDTYDQVRAGARLILSYDQPSNAFVGTLENTTAAVLPNVRVEVHLSNGVELGPTTPLDLAPGQVQNLRLPALGSGFMTWSAHPEVGAQGDGGEAGNEGGNEGSGS